MKFMAAIKAFTLSDDTGPSAKIVHLRVSYAAFAIRESVVSPELTQAESRLENG